MKIKKYHDNTNLHNSTEHFKLGRLVLKNGLSFNGYSFGADKAICGEVVFNTGMVGYPETLTDPSYKGQILVLTHPLIGNYGVPGKERKDGLSRFFESDQIQVRGLIISDYSNHYHHWNAKQSLGQWLKDFSVPGIYGIDTRKLTKILRVKGTLLGKIICGKDDMRFEDPNKKSLVPDVSVKKPVVYPKGPKRILLVDCGVKNSIIRSFFKKEHFGYPGALEL